MVVDDKGQIVAPETPEPAGPRRRLGRGRGPELKPGQTRKEIEGVFVVRKDGRAQFVPVKTGIAGEKYFEVLDGLKEGDEVITGPFASVRAPQGGRQCRDGRRAGPTHGAPPSSRSQSSSAEHAAVLRGAPASRCRRSGRTSCDRC